MALRDAIKNESKLDIIPQETPEGESQSNGRVEGSIELIKGQVRTMRLALQSRHDRVI